MLTNTRKHVLSMLIDGVHSLNLGILLIHVVLIDADGINPDVYLPTIRESLLPSIVAVSVYVKDDSVDQDLGRIPRISPCV